MAGCLTDEKLQSLIGEPKRLPTGWRDRLEVRRKRTSEERLLNVAGEAGGRFRVVLRQSVDDLDDFSVVLAYEVPGEPDLLHLRRYNGRSHAHTNALEGDHISFAYHIHYATCRYQQRGEKADGYAVESGRYCDVESALTCVLQDCGFRGPEEPEGEIGSARPEVREAAGPAYGRVEVIANRVDEAFRTTMRGSIRLVSQGADAFRVATPFVFGDGDHLVVVLKRDEGGWLLTDQGHTRMHLGYWTPEEEFEREPVRGAIARILARYSVEDHDGRFILPVQDGEYGAALFRFVQALMEIVGAVTAVQQTDRGGDTR